MELYHGRNVPGIKNFTSAENTTVGLGIYLTDDKLIAKMYAIRRFMNRGGVPVIYTVYVDDGMKILDLADKEMLYTTLQDFAKYLRRNIYNRSKFPWNTEWVISKFLEETRDVLEGRSSRLYPTTLRNVDVFFTGYLKSFGYEGLWIIEGGEGNIPKHKTCLVFDPRKVKIPREEKLKIRKYSKIPISRLG